MRLKKNSLSLWSWRRKQNEMKKLFIILISVVLISFLIGASPPPKKYPAQTGTYKTGKYKSSSAHGKGGCFIEVASWQNE